MSKIKKRILIGILLIMLGGIGTGLYMWFKPHRDVQSAKAFAQLTTTELVNEFSTDPVKSNAKYLSADGNSKVLIIEGKVSKISTNQIGETVILLKEDSAKVGVSATFLKEANTTGVKINDVIKIKGAITAGNSYDKDLDLYENAILLHCDIAK